MRFLTLAAIVAGVVVLPAGGHAATAKRIHRHHQAAYMGAPAAQDTARSRLNYFGNAAAEGNNANSMSGDNSAGENANGRTSGSGFR
jgi:hypothetical protein